MTSVASEAVIRVEAPYRLDLTVAVLRRFSTNIVDVTDSSGAYVRALEGTGGPIVARVRQTSGETLAVRLEDVPAREAIRTLAIVRRMLGTEHRPRTFEREAAQIPWLQALALRMRGVRAPRYPTLWEACVNAVVFQQVSLLAASAILRRTILALGERVRRQDVESFVFPAPARFTAASDAALRAAGLSAAKIATLRRMALVLENGVLDETMLEQRSSAAAAALLCETKGIGPWTAAVILLRGLGRLDVFPANDSGVARSVLAIGGGTIDVPAVLERLGSERGMLYFHFLLQRLETSGGLETEPRFS